VKPPLNGGTLARLSEGGSLEAVPQIEPTMITSLAQDWAAVSAAISAKRQADALEAIAGVLTGSGDQAALFGMMQNLMWEAGRSFQAGLRTDR